MITPYEGGQFKVTSIIGVRSIPSLGLYNDIHYGLDIVGLSSKNILAVKAGKVISSLIITDKSNATWQWGNYICINSPDGINTYYRHLAKRLVKVEDAVKVGDVIGIEGATGQVTGSHLHIEMRKGNEKCRIPAIINDPCNVATAIGIQNAVETYIVPQNDDMAVKNAINTLVKYKIINTPDYWVQNYGKVEYLDVLLIRCAESIVKTGVAKSTVQLGITELQSNGMINTPQHWLKSYMKLEFLDELLMRLGGAVYK